MNRADDDGFRELSWTLLARLKAEIYQNYSENCTLGQLHIRNLGSSDNIGGVSQSTGPFQFDASNDGPSFNFSSGKYRNSEWEEFKFGKK